MEPDLSHSITMHPHPFPLEHISPSQSRSPARHSLAAPATGLAGSSSGSNNNNNSSNNDYGTDDKNNASSTGVEVNADEAIDAATERHPSSHPMSPSGFGDHSNHSVRSATDIESQTTTGLGAAGRLPVAPAENDPYGLASAYKTDSDLANIVPSGARKRKSAAASGIGSGGVLASSRRGSGSDSDSNDGVHNSDNNNDNDHNNGDDGDVYTGAPAAVPVSTTTGASGRAFQPQSRGALLARCLPILVPFLPSVTSSARRAVRTRRLRGFYQSQNATIERMLKSVEEHQADARQEQGDDQLRYRIAVYGSFAANVVLAGLQVYGAVSSGSLSLFTTMADAIFDPLSNTTLILTNRAIKRVNPARFPSGKARLETIGNIVFCFLMTSVSFILIAFSIRDLVSRSGGDDETNKFHLPSVLAVAIAFATKFVLFLYTWLLKDRYSQVYILWQDHRNDLLVNGFGILTSVGGSKLVWWIDPAGAIIIGVTVSYLWLKTAFSEFLLLVGVVASVETQQLITYVCVTHSQAVRQIDTVRVYHSGPRLIAEVDVVMDPGTTLAESHDVAEALQSKLECLPDIERAYVHVDYETTHKPEHAFKKDI